ncbi:unnamed protein product [Acanthosepion pharaonis]|uniref:Uncharacterized protein n=1 Tax=Acanthosepion pharaonis TaxID=158019 RepID=A0A812D5Q3_ACAPH|nr:unnamed protein product [Sepia pharaonis]
MARSVGLGLLLSISFFLFLPFFFYNLPVSHLFKSASPPVIFLLPLLLSYLLSCFPFTLNFSLLFFLPSSFPSFSDFLFLFFFLSFLFSYKAISLFSLLILFFFSLLSLFSSLLLFFLLLQQCHWFRYVRCIRPKESYIIIISLFLNGSINIQILFIHDAYSLSSPTNPTVRCCEGFSTSPTSLRTEPIHLLIQNRISY